ncbi:hypothetical protein CTRI78_v006007 [Colletotrichum trifolii]|uniref:Uncharacterized protein n=1 Tax=Colletotrichum trifolii TaxID=5466 RepID=A0A4R8RPM4_COLTR|nr:hypothetical protein CTRI78_v006007 [Colletotrichum trifolii]
MATCPSKDMLWDVKLACAESASALVSALTEDLIGNLEAQPDVPRPHGVDVSFNCRRALHPGPHNALERRAGGRGSQ